MRRGLVVCILSSAATALVRSTSLWRAPRLGGAPDGEAEVETVWGASYIGGDPCSSGYNDDPFDERASTLDDYDAFKARVAAIVQANVPGSLTTDKLDAVRAFEVMAEQRGMMPLCGWRALFTAGHANCVGGRRCACARGAPAYAAAAEGPLIEAVRMLSPPDAARRIVAP